MTATSVNNSGSVNSGTKTNKTEHKHDHKHSHEVKMIIGMDAEQARAVGGEDLYQKFLKADIDENGKLSETEVGLYYGSGISDKELDEFKNLSDDEKIIKIIETFGSMIPPKEIEKIKSKSNKKVPIENLVKDRLGIDLSDYKTDEEKKDAIFNAMQAKYSTDYSDEDLENVMTDESGRYKDSVYLQTYKNIKEGNFGALKGPLAEKLEGYKGKLSEEQIRAYAKEYTMTAQAFEFAALQSCVEPEDSSLITDRLSDYDVHVQSVSWGVRIARAETKEEKLELAEKFHNDINAKINAGEDSGKLSALLIMMYSNIEQTRASILAHKCGCDRAQTEAVKIMDKAELYKLETGQISQAEYDSNYVKIYAAMAHQLDEADEAYKYVMEHANDNNRAGTMKVLAENAYMIQDETRRGNAISSLKNSQYYNSDVQAGLDKGYLNSLKNNSASANYSNSNVTNPNNNSFGHKVLDTINTNDETKIKKLIDTTLDRVDEKGVAITQQEKKLRNENTVTLLNKVISNNLLQNSKYERIVLNKLSAKSPQTILNLFFACNTKVQEYLYKNKIIPLIAIDVNCSSEQKKQLPDKIKEDLENRFKPELMTVPKGLDPTKDLKLLRD